MQARPITNLPNRLIRQSHPPTLGQPRGIARKVPPPMNFPMLLPLLLGTLVVFQPALNRRVGETRGLSVAVVVNATVLLLLAFLLLLTLHWLGDRAPEWLRPRATPFRLWHLLPGGMGFALVLLVPMAYRQVGALATAVWMLCGQMVTALVWDALNDGPKPTLARVAGTLLAMGGALLTSRG